MALIDSENLDLAVSARGPLTVTSADGSVATQAKFLSVAAEQPGIWVQVLAASAKEAGELAETLAAAVAGVTGCFTQEGKRYLFDTRVLRRDPHHWLTDSVYVDAMLLEIPTEVSSPENRKATRHRISDSVGGIHAKLYRTGDNGAPCEVLGTLWDLSTGGASFVCPVAKSALDLTPRHALAMDLNFRGKRILLPARRSHVRQISARSVRVGLRFDFSRATTAPAQAALLQACAQLDAQSRTKAA